MKGITKKLFLLIISVILISENIISQNYRTVNSVQARDIIKQNEDKETFVIIDARRKSQYNEGHIPKAINIDPNNPESAKKLSEMDTSATYLIYCRTRNRIIKLLKLMHNKGYSNVILMTDGWLVWKQHGYEIEMPCWE